jgi:hypothetical protein
VLQGFDDGGADVDPVEPFDLDALQEAFECVPLLEFCSVSPGQELPIALPELDISDPDVPNLMPALNRGPGRPRGRVLVYLGSDVLDEECKPHVDK